MGRERERKRNSERTHLKRQRYDIMHVQLLKLYIMYLSPHGCERVGERGEGSEVVFCPIEQSGCFQSRGKER